MILETHGLKKSFAIVSQMWSIECQRFRLPINGILRQSPRTQDRPVEGGQAGRMLLSNDLLTP